jgi:hypothetical protein
LPGIVYDQVTLKKSCALFCPPAGALINLAAQHIQRDDKEVFDVSPRLGRLPDRVSVAPP